MRKISVLKVIVIGCLMMFVSTVTFAHDGAHGNEECLIAVGDVELRLNGYQFKGKNPDKHYCRHFPHLGQTILKLDSSSTDLTDMGLEITLLKRNSWMGLLTNSDDAYSVVKQLPIQYFSKQVVSIEDDIQARDIYAIKLRLHAADGKITEQQFSFFVGVPFALVLVIISVFLLLFISFIFLKQLRKH